MKLNVTERETLAKRITQEVHRINLEKLTKRYAGNADFITLKKQLAEEQRAQRKAAELNKKLHANREAFNTKHKLKDIGLMIKDETDEEEATFNFKDLDPFCNGDWKFRRDMEEEIILEGLQQNGDIKKVMEVLIERFTV